MSDYHIIDMWGYYCETWCELCKKEKRICETCGRYYSPGQRHETDCINNLKEDKSKQLELPFKY